MKHKLSITTVLCLIFLFSQLFGIFTASHTTEIVKINDTVEVESKETTLTPRPEVKDFSLIISIVIGILIGTGLILLLKKLKKPLIWKVWYGFAVFFCVGTALSAFINETIAMIIAALSVIIKLTNKFPFLSNLLEILVYTGIALIFGPLLSPWWALALLLIIAIYDYIAVFKIKHMISLAEFQKDSGAFSGLRIDYGKDKDKTSKKIPKKELKSDSSDISSKKTLKSAILGGGDIAFPLIFNISFFQWAAIASLSEIQSFIAASWIAVFQTISLFLLFILAKKDRYYPAIPFLTGGTIIGAISSIALFIL